MSKIEKILKYVDSIPNYTAKLVNRFTCSKEEEVLNVLDELTHFGTTIGETTRRLYREIDRASSLGYTWVNLR